MFQPGRTFLFFFVFSFLGFKHLMDSGQIIGRSYMKCKNFCVATFSGTWYDEVVFDFSKLIPEPARDDGLGMVEEGEVVAPCLLTICEEVRLKLFKDISEFYQLGLVCVFLESGTSEVSKDETRDMGGRPKLAG